MTLEFDNLGHMTRTVVECNEVYDGPRDTTVLESIGVYDEHLDRPVLECLAFCNGRGHATIIKLN